MERFFEIIAETLNGFGFGVLVALPGSILIYYAARGIAYLYNRRKWPKW